MKKDLLLTLLFCTLLFPYYGISKNVYGYPNVDQQEVVRIGLKVDPPFVMREITSENDTSYYGLSVDLWEEIASELNLMYEIIEYEHTSGLVMALSYENVDIVINPMLVSPTRLRSLEVTQPFLTSSIGVVLRKHNDNLVSIFLSNLFSLEFIKLISMLVGIVFFFGTVVWWVEKKYNKEDFRDGIYGIMDGVWWSTVTITTVGYGDKTPKTTLGRVISMIWMFAAISLVSSFTATITSKLTIEQLDNKASSLKDLEKLGKVGVVASSECQDYLFRNNINISRAYKTPSEGLEALHQGKIKVFAHDRPTLRYLVSEKEWVDRFELLPQTFNKHYYSWLLPKRSKLASKIDPKLIEITSVDSWNRLLHKYNLDE
ncbi:ion channel [Algivirga pacifica]|uniref:Transporter substrate-binding domain-containing protein n=1 Tax=Algivirga pacifica TaxID=1162670 RepID=A0ABP9DLD4_9BACT